MKFEKSILFIDDDHRFSQNIVVEVELFGIVEYVRTIIAGEAFLLDPDAHIGSVILDMHMPNPDPELYTDDDTNSERSTGLIFLRRNKEFLIKNKIPTLILTNRYLDESLRKELCDSEMPKNLLRFEHKHDISARDVPRILLEMLQIVKMHGIGDSTFTGE